ncbi:MAG: hypothetical protein P8M61_07520 [Crocinitomicaceae bacterium]|jgi:hypothetical protein|nr:hypothetical protein [Crocinitomicaceae bacterium]
MVRVLFISSLVVLASCASMKERKAEKMAAQAPTAVKSGSEDENAAPTQSRPASEEDMMGIQGTVRLNKPGCPVQIEMINGDLYSTAYPVNLDKQYHKEGLLIKFNFAPSRAPSPESCTADAVISVSEVEILKK